MPVVNLDDPNFIGPLLEWTRRGAEVGTRVQSVVFSEDPTDKSAPCALFVKAEPNHSFRHHAHPTWRLEVIIKGSVQVGDKLLKPGDIMFSKPGEFYGPHRSGPEGHLAVEFFGRMDGIAPVLEDGHRIEDDIATHQLDKK